MEGSRAKEFRLGTPPALLILGSIGFANITFRALAGGDTFTLAWAVPLWGLLLASVTWGGRRVISAEGARVAWRTIRWEDVTSATCRFGFIELRTAKRPFNLFDNARTRKAILICAPEDHPVRAALAKKRLPRLAWLNAFTGLVVLAVLAVLGSAFVATQLWFKNHQRSREIDTSYATHLAKFEHDARVASALHVFRPPFDGVDASAFLSPRVRWCPPGGSSGVGTSVLPRLPAGCQTWMDDACLDATLRERTDLSWMQELARYGYWDLFTVGPASAAVARLAPDDGDGRLDLPRPVWGEIVLAARFRLATGETANDIPRAIGETRHLARLSYSTESFSGAMAALTILTAETRLRAKVGRLAEETQLPAAIPESTLDAAWRALRAYESFFSPLAPASARARLLTDPHVHFARCQALGGGVRTGVIVRPILETPLLLARDYRVDYAAMNKILDASRAECRLSDERREWAATSTTTRHLLPLVRLSGESLAAPTVGLDAAYGR